MFLGELLLWMGGQGSIVLAVATTGTSASSASTGWQTNRAICAWNDLNQWDYLKCYNMCMSE